MKFPPKKNVVIYLTVFLLIPIVILSGIILFNDRAYNLISLIVAAASCVPFFIRFERKKQSARELVTLAVMTAISVVSRLIFMPLAFFKPVSAVIVITGIAFGQEAGFIVGSLSALLSNVFYGQGPWTPFQMIMWGLIGFFSGIVFRQGKKPNKIILCICGMLSGLFYSLGMDIWTVLSIDGTFLFSRYLSSIIAALPVTAVYMLSNVFFLLVLTAPILEKTERMRIKYGIFN